MLIIGETLNERKASLWSYIHVCQDLIKSIQGCSISKSSLAKEVIAMEREQIKNTYAELKAVQRWGKQSGLDPDEPYRYGGKYVKE